MVVVHGDYGVDAARPRVLGLPVDALTMERAVERVAAAVTSGRLNRVMVTNANKAWLAHRDPELRGLMEAADLVVAEYATAWAARRLGVAGVDHIGGLTLMMRLLAEAPLRGWRVYLLGAEAAVVDALAARLRARAPRLQIVGVHHGYFDDGSADVVRASLRAARPDLLFVAMGSPRQERFIAGLDDAHAGVAIGVGGSFDVLAGRKRDAPRWMRGRGLEWLYRLGQDPRRLWRRYLVTNAWFAFGVAREALRRPRA
jgi:N-acetylglucosaminyldiphosphoundecaprenol N-acetyl-beta-D-mannosaminyltransferase